MNEKSQQNIFETGLSLYSKKQYTEALPYFEALTQDSLLILKYYYLGLTLVQLGRLTDALSAYRHIHEISKVVEGVEYDKIMYGLYINMGSLLQVLAKKNGTEMYKESASCYKYALQISDVDPRVWNNLGNIYLELQDNLKAIKSFKKAIELDDEYPEAYYCLSLAYEFSGQYQKAIEQLKTELKWRSRNKTVLNRLSALLFGVGKFKEAKQYINRVLDSDPDDPKALKNLSLVLYNLGDFKASYEIYQKLIIVNPDFHEPEVQSIFDDLVEKNKQV
ncbi:MAG: tetratricopeptide repeat protein [Promethearchaeota archaeon]